MEKTKFNEKVKCVKCGFKRRSLFVIEDKKYCNKCIKTIIP